MTYVHQVKEFDFDIGKCCHYPQNLQGKQSDQSAGGWGTGPPESQRSDCPVLWRERGRRVSASITDGRTQQRPGSSTVQEVV